jgi:hypothetical protein
VRELFSLKNTEESEERNFIIPSFRDSCEETFQIIENTERLPESVAQELEPAQGLSLELRGIFLNYPEIKEAYLIEADELYRETLTTEEERLSFFKNEKSQDGEVRHMAVIGLLTEDIEADRKFYLIQAIAEISLRRFQDAQAIEVFDDLGEVASFSQKLFLSFEPFYWS